MLASASDGGERAEGSDLWRDIPNPYRYEIVNDATVEHQPTSTPSAIHPRVLAEFWRHIVTRGHLRKERELWELWLGEKCVAALAAAWSDLDFGPAGGPWRDRTGERHAAIAMASPPITAAIRASCEWPLAMNFYQASKTAKTPGQKRCLLVLPNGAVAILQFTADQPLLVTCFFPNDVLDEYRRREKSGRFWQRTVRCYVRTYAEDVARQPRHPRTEYTVEVENRQGGPVLRSRIHFVLPENWGFEQETPSQLVWSNRLPDWPAATRERAAGPMDHQATSARARYPLSPRPASTAGGVEHE